MARATGHFGANLRANASPNHNGLKSKVVERQKSYRLVSVWLKLCQFNMHFLIKFDSLVEDGQDSGGCDGNSAPQT